MSSVIHTTPAFLKALGNLAKENQVSNKEFKAKLAHKAERIKQLQRQRKIAEKMDKELTKLEKNAAKEQAKQAKIAEKEAKKQAKEAKLAEKQAKKLARAVTTDTDSDESVHTDVEKVVVAEKTVKKTVAKKQSKAKAENNDRTDIIRSICEQLDAAHIHENKSAAV